MMIDFLGQLDGWGANFPLPPKEREDKLALLRFNEEEAAFLPLNRRGGVNYEPQESNDNEKISLSLSSCCLEDRNEELRGI